MTVALIGSSMLKPGARSPKPCHLSSARIIQSSRLPMPSSASVSGPQTLNHQSSPYSSSTLRIARRKSSASMIDSSTSAVPPGGSIIAAATSHDAMIAYCGDVDVCIRYASLKRWRSSLRVSLSCTRICDACDSPASSLCVECVEKISASLRARPVAADRVHAAVEIVERRVRQPRLVEMQRVDLRRQQLLDRVDVVEHAVVGALRERQDARLAS